MSTDIAVAFIPSCKPSGTEHSYSVIISRLGRSTKKSPRPHSSIRVVQLTPRGPHLGSSNRPRYFCPWSMPSKPTLHAIPERGGVMDTQSLYTRNPLAARVDPTERAGVEGLCAPAFLLTR
jgi:hypothetical protein